MIKKYIAKACLKADSKDIEKMEHFFSILQEENKHYNLTAIETVEEAAIRHFVDSLMLSKSEEFVNAELVLDVGSGAGFPGLPLAIVYKQKQFVLLDALQKRVKFLQKCVRDLSLENVEVVHERAETFARLDKYREKFDIVTARAVAELTVLSEYCLPAVQLGGSFIAMKSQGISEELIRAEKAINILGGGEIKQIKYQLDDGRLRQLLVIKKILSTPQKYPRRPGMPKKKPL